MNYKTSKSTIEYLLGSLILVLCLVGLALQIRRVMAYDDSLSGLLMVSTFFTNHANLFVFISTMLMLLKISNKHVDRFAFITTVDITITCIVFFALLLPWMSEVTFLQILLHGIIPPLFIGYYFYTIETKLTHKQAWISLIHPFIYFLFVHLFVHPLYGDFIHQIFPLEIDPYVYPFLNPAYYNHGILGMIAVNYLVLFPVAFLLSFFILLFKNRVDQTHLSI